MKTDTAPGGCTNTDNGIKDIFGDDCKYYEKHTEWCGHSDDRFDATKMCCVCGGGNRGSNGGTCSDQKPSWCSSHKGEAWFPSWCSNGKTHDYFGGTTLM